MISSQKPSTIKAVFSNIAEKYDKLNSWMTLGIYKSWNQELVNTVQRRSTTNHLLDLCAGTGAISELFIRQKKQAKSTLIDFCKPMLDLAKKRLGAKARYIEADVMELPIKDAAFEAITISYGIRNVRYPKRCIAEAYRVLKPGGVLAILELTRPKNFLIRLLHRLWLRITLPLLGKAIAKNKEAYCYLSNSVEQFLPVENLIFLLKSAGFSSMQIKQMSFGAVTLISAKKELSCNE